MAHKHLTTALREIAERTGERVDELRTLELERLDALLAAQWEAAMSGDVRAADRVLRVSERRSRLLGLELPVRSERQFQFGIDDVFKSDTIEQGRAEMAEFLAKGEYTPRGLSQ